MEPGEWARRDISLPRLLSVVRAFVEILLLASGFQRSGSPAFWRSQDVSRAIKWASVIEQIIAKVFDHKDARESLDRALETLMLETFYPEGLPRLTCEVLGEAKNLLFHAMSHALGSGNGQIESLVASACKDEKDIKAVLEQIRERVVVAESIKSVKRALDVVSSLPMASNHIRCACQPWRQEAVSYLLKGTTHYKISGAAVLFKCSSAQWKAALQRSKDQSGVNKVADIVELCCLYLSMSSRSLLLMKLLEPCDRMCSVEAIKTWQPENCRIEGAILEDTVAVEAYLYDLTQHDKKIWWSLPPILVAAALTKGSFLFNHYNAQLSRAIAGDNEAELCSNRNARYADKVLDNNLNQRYERKWCVWFVQSTVASDKIQPSVKE